MGIDGGMITLTCSGITISKSLTSANQDELQVEDVALAYMVAVVLGQYRDKSNYKDYIVV